MGRVCSWCGAFLALVAGGGTASVSHALCSGCLEELRAELAKEGMRLPRGEEGLARS